MQVVRGNQLCGSGEMSQNSRADSPRFLAEGFDSDQVGASLRARNFDGLVLNQIDFSGADLRGANMSECTIRGCSFENADLVDVCFSETVFEDCDFSFARFGAP